VYVVQLTVIKSINCIDDHPLTSLKICRKSGNYIAPSRYHSGDFALNTLTQRCRLHGSGPSMGWVGSIVKFKKIVHKITVTYFRSRQLANKVKAVKLVRWGCEMG